MLYWRKFFVLCRKVYFWLYPFLSNICKQDGLVGILYSLFPSSLFTSVRPGWLPARRLLDGCGYSCYNYRTALCVRLEQRNHESRVREQRTRTSRVGHWEQSLLLSVVKNKWERVRARRLLLFLRGMDEMLSFSCQSDYNLIDETPGRT